MKGSIGKFLFRIHPTKLNFFKGVKYDSEETKEAILDWMFKSQVYHVSIHKFSDLFVKCPGIVFPISLSKRSLYYFEIIDRNGNVSFLDYSSSYDRCYSIRTKNDLGDVNIDFKIIKDHIVLKKVNILPLDEHGVCTKDDSFSIAYNCEKNTTIITIKKVTGMKPYLKIVYPSQDKDFDNEVLSYLIKTDLNLNDVFPLFKSIYEIRELKDLSIKVVDHSVTISNIILENGEVSEYSFAESISESKVCLSRIDTLQDVREFIDEHSC